jgi:peptidyl-prolyl cis-trans isomerase D
MLQLFRNFFKSKLGIVVTLAFLGLIAFAFASSDVANTGTFGGVTGGDRVAVVGERRIDAADLSIRTTDAVNLMRQDDPTMTIEGFIANGGMQEVLDAVVGRAAIAELAHAAGLRAGQRLVDSEIVNNPNLRAADGSFDAEGFRNALRQQGVSEEMFRDDLALGLYARQLVVPATLAPQMPTSLARRYTALRMETRSGNIAAFQAGAYLPVGDPTEEQLQSYYEANSSDYIRPERRVIRYASFGEEAFGDLPSPTSEQVAERYERDLSLYQERELRSFTQLITTTQAAAQAIVDEVNGGVSLEASARSKGLSTSTIQATTADDLQGSTSAAVADAAFAADEGTVSTPAQGGLGWYVLRVDSVDRIAGRSLEEAAPEITETLRAEQRRIALNDATARIEDEFSDGRSLSEVAEELGLEITTTRPVTATGQVYNAPETAPAIIGPVLEVAFEMNEADPQLAEVIPGQTFLIFDVSQITNSSVAPLDEIRELVSDAWRFDEGMNAAGEAARRVITRVNEGASLGAAISAEEIAVQAPDSLTLSRAEIERTPNIPRPIALFFSMAKGTVKPLETPEAGAWFVIQLDDIVTPEVSDTDPALLTTSAQLLPLLPDEYAVQFVAAIQDELDIEINQVAIDAVEAQLTGRTN